MAVGKRGPKRKYDSPDAIRKAVDAYWDCISYQRCVVVTEPTGEVDERGNVVLVTRMLQEKNGTGGRNGPPVTVTEYIERPSLEGLCLYMGITRDTWATYAKDEKLGEVCAWAKERVRKYLMDRLDGNHKHIQGILFDLKNNHGMSDRMEITQKEGGVEAYLAALEAGGDQHGY